MSLETFEMNKQRKNVHPLLDHAYCYNEMIN